MKSPGNKTRKLYLIDAHHFLHRAHHALAGSALTNSRGEPVWALYGFARMLLGLVKKQKPEAIGVCFDAPGPTFRHAEFAEYKANRPEIDPALRSQFPMARELADALGLKVVEVPGFEADDLMASLAKKGHGAGYEVVLVTGDKDALQLVGPGIRVLDSKDTMLDAAKVEEKYGVAPGQLVDYFSLTGDAIDNVPGARGIGPKTAVMLLREFHTLDRILKKVKEAPSDFSEKVARSLEEFRPQAEKTRRLIRLSFDAPVPDPSDCEIREPGERTVQVLRELEFNTLIAEVFPEGARGAEPAGGVEKVGPAEFEKRLKSAARVSIGLWEGDPPAIMLGLPDGAVCPVDGARARRLLSGGRTKLGHDLKRAVKSLELQGPFFDTALAAWLVNPSRARYGLADIVLEHLGKPVVLAPGPEAAAGEAALVWELAAKLEKALKDEGLERLYRDVEIPVMEVLAEMEKAGIGVDTAYLGRLSKEFEAGISALLKEIEGFAGAALNPNSPKQVAAVLFGKLNLPAVRKTKTGYSTDEDTLRTLSAKHPLPAKLLEYREWTKLKSTYIDTLLEVASNGRVHTTFNQTGAVTGRLSSVNPNLQNVPIRTPLGMKIRRAFVPAKGCLLVSADYSQIDLRLLAHESGDPALMESFRIGEDVHLRTASELFHKKPGEVGDNDRRVAKAVNFGVAYGQTPHGLAQGLGIPIPEAQRIITRYFERYRGVKDWIESHLQRARKEGKVRTWLGRIRYLPELASKNQNLRAFAERAAVNTTIQGGSADVMKKAMLAVARGLPARFPRARLVLQVHDELLFEAPEKEAGELAAWAKDEMEGAASLRVPLVVDLKAGKNWAEMERLRAAV